MSMSGTCHASVAQVTGPCEQLPPEGRGRELLSTDVLPRRGRGPGPAAVFAGPLRPPGLLTVAQPTSVQGTAGVVLSMPRYTTPAMLAPYRPGETLMKNASWAGARAPNDAKPFANATKACELPVESSACSTAFAADSAELASTVSNSASDTEETVATGVSTVAGRQLTEPPSSGGEELAEAPVLGSAALPSAGSQGHHLGICKPCAFIFKSGCENGALCSFCHLCAPDEKKRRKKDWKEQQRQVAGAAWATAAAATAVVAVPAAPGWHAW